MGLYGKFNYNKIYWGMFITFLQILLLWIFAGDILWLCPNGDVWNSFIGIIFNVGYDVGVEGNYCSFLLPMCLFR